MNVALVIAVGYAVALTVALAFMWVATRRSTPRRRNR